MLKNARLAKHQLRSQPDYIIFEDCLRVKVPTGQQYTIPTPELAGQTVSMETMYALFEKHKQTYDQMEWELRRAFTYAEYINEALANNAIVPDGIRASLGLDILNLTYFDGPLHRWVLRDILHAYEIKYKTPDPNCEISVDEDGELLMPAGNYENNEKVRELVTDTIRCLAKHYKPDRPQPTVTITDNATTPVSQPTSPEQIQQAVDKFNARTGLPNKPQRIEFEDMILLSNWDSVFNEKKPGFMTLRGLGWGEWDYMTSELKTMHLANEPMQAWELACLFTTKERGRTLAPSKSSLIKFQDASIVNMLIFGKSNISRDMVPTVLSLIRFGHSPSMRTQLDNYVIDRSEHRYVSDPITWRDDNVHNELAFPQTDSQRLEVAKGLIHLMNETDPKELNMVNYYLISEWIHTYKKQVTAIADMQVEDTLYRGTVHTKF
jgi:hypothetical protein